MFTKKSLGATCLGAGVLAALGAVPNVSSAAMIISEVAPWGSGDSDVGADWFELTNTGPSAVTITGWRVDDSSNSFSEGKVLNGITSIGAGESVIFLESGSSLSAEFIDNWFGGSGPAGLQIGRYSGSGVGLSTDGDAVSVFNGSGALQARVTFGASDGSEPYQTFVNSAMVNNGAISLLSADGVNGAFLDDDGEEIGSPGSVPAPVPLPAAAWLLLSGLGMLGTAAKRKRA